MKRLALFFLWPTMACAGEIDKSWLSAGAGDVSITTTFKTQACALARIAPDGTVTIDWDCIEKPQSDPTAAAWSKILRAVRDGTTKEMPR